QSEMKRCRADTKKRVQGAGCWAPGGNGRSDHLSSCSSFLSSHSSFSSLPSLFARFTCGTLSIACVTIGRRCLVVVLLGSCTCGGETAMVFSAFDVDGDQTVSLKEFLETCSFLMQVVKDGQVITNWRQKELRSLKETWPNQAQRVGNIKHQLSEPSLARA
ncbi:unnamed protein product, partial [Prorocentrum cordatum]